MISGCQTFGTASTDSPADQTALAQNDDAPSRWGRNRKGDDERNVIQTRAWMTLGRPEFTQASKLAEEKKYAEAEKILKRIARREEYEDAFVREEAIFMLGTVQFEQQKYAQADDTFHQLFKEFPSSRYTEKSTVMLFTIAQEWLQLKTISGTDEIQQVNYDNVAATPPPVDDRPLSPTARYAVLPNFFDRSRPMFDTQGRALRTLRTIWLNDPTGPLADDALMITASHHFRRGQYEEADRYYTILRDEYPKSEHVQTAFTMGGHVKLLSYQGAEYDGNPLKDAETIRRSTLTLFPNSPERDKIEAELIKLEETKAARGWQKVRFYQRKDRPKAVAVAAVMLIQEHPTSKYAPLAKNVLSELPPEVLRDSGTSGAVQAILSRTSPSTPTPTQNYDSPTGNAPRSGAEPAPFQKPDSQILPLTPDVGF